MERSLEEAFSLVARLDAVALSENNSITVALASRVLRNVLERN
jgi:chromosomal replication initiation ATPase DnaA